MKEWDSVSRVVPQTSNGGSVAVRRFALLALVLAATLLLATPAAAAPTKVIVSLRTPAFHGKLKSSRSSCVTDRRVKLFRRKAGPDKLLGSDVTDRNAKWSIPIGKRLRSGASYYAKAPAKGSCKAGKSNVLTIG
jgi:hypothetical protein